MSISRRDFVRALGLSGVALHSSSKAGDSMELMNPRMSSSNQPFNRLYDAGFINLSSNTSPRGPSDAVLEVLRGRISPSLGRYPENTGLLIEAIAEKEKSRRDQVLLSTGSGEVLVGAVHAFVTATRPLVIGIPSYETPVATAELLDLPVKSVPVDERLQLDLDAMAEAAVGAGLVYLCNPNNPTGVAHSASSIKKFVKQVQNTSPETAILIDEAYIEFANDPTVSTALPLALNFPNIMITRTFSKVYAMAGLRIGYALGQTETLERMKRTARFGSVTVLSATAGLAALQDSVRRSWEIEENRKVREFTLNAFRQIGREATNSQTNFVWANVGQTSKSFRDACFELDVLVGRDFRPIGNHYSRISLGTMDEMRQAVQVFETVLTENE